MRWASATTHVRLLALNDRTIRDSANDTALLIAIVVVSMISLYAHSKDDTGPATATTTRRRAPE